MRVTNEHNVVTAPVAEQGHGQRWEMFSHRSHRKTGSSAWDPERSARSGRNTEHLQELPVTSSSSQACVTSVVDCWCFLFWFLSRPGTVAICDSCTLALRWLWPLFIFIFFFSSNEFPLVFPDTVCKRNSGIIVSKFPGPVLGQKPVV